MSNVSCYHLKGNKCKNCVNFSQYEKNRNKNIINLYITRNHFSSSIKIIEFVKMNKLDIRICMNLLSKYKYACKIFSVKIL